MLLYFRAWACVRVRCMSVAVWLGRALTGWIIGEDAL